MAARTQGHSREWLGGGILLAGLVVGYSVLFPGGAWGRRVDEVCAWILGGAKYLAPLLMVSLGVRWLVEGKARRPLLPFLGAGLGLSSLATALTLLGRAIEGQGWGGAVGQGVADFFIRSFGVGGAWLVSVLGVVLGLCGWSGMSPLWLTRELSHRLMEDWREWLKARHTVTPRRPSVIEPRPLSAEPDPLMAPSKPRVRGPIPMRESPAIEAQVPPLGAPIQPPTPGPSPKTYVLPPVSLLADGASAAKAPTEAELISQSHLLERTLATFGVQAKTTDIHPGPVITRFDLEPAPGVKISSFVALADDIALALKAVRVRVLAPIPGQGAVGFEIPNPHPAVVTLKDIVSDARFQNSRGALTVALGKTSEGEPCVTDLAPMPHLLVAGATGTGKSVCIHALLMSILMRSTPDRVKFLLIDPKRLELPFYDGLPHLYDPRTGPEGAHVITQPKDAAVALQRLVKVMEHRYELFAQANVRNIEGYNEKRVQAGLPPEFYLVVVIDELADLMLVSAREVEDAIQRLAQMARAVGIHLVLATQRPSVDVITGVIKANLPARVALRVASQTDSRVILDTVGAESLVGRGDMLFLPGGAPVPFRIQGAYVSEAEVERVVAHWRAQGGPAYDDIFAQIAAQDSAREDAETRQELDEALRLIMERKRVSQDLLKAHFGSSARATNVLSLLEVREFIHKPEGTNRWEIDFQRIEDFFRSAAPRKTPVVREV